MVLGNYQINIDFSFVIDKFSNKILTGEFNYEKIEENFEEDIISKAFTMILLLGLMLFGTVTLINLLVGVVISDINKLQKDVLQRVKYKSCSSKYKIKGLNFPTF